MKMAQIGCGKMGVASAFALATEPAVTRLTLVDRDRSRAEKAARRIAPYAVGSVTVSSDPETSIPGQDAVTMALPWEATRWVIDLAAAGGTPMASITRPPVDDLAWIDATGRTGGAPLLLPVGLEPGLTELLAASLAEQFDHTSSVEIFCGGIPCKPRGPIGHVTFFGGESAHHLPIAQRDAYAVTAGRVVRVPRFSGLEQRFFDGVGTLQAYHDGMVPWLCDHPDLDGADGMQKTVRWPGFGEAVTELARLGLLAEEPIDLDGVPVVPRRFTERVLAPQLIAGAQDRDMVVLDVAAHGTIAGRPASLHTRLRDLHDPATALSAMARTTGFTLAAAGTLLAEGAVGGAGWLMPHLALRGEVRQRLVRSLIRRGIEITTTPAPIARKEHDESPVGDARPRGSRNRAGQPQPGRPAARPGPGDQGVPRT